MAQSMYSNKVFLNMLNLYGFDFQNYVPVFVVFHDTKNNGYTNRNKKYFYKMSKSFKPKENAWVVCPVYNENRFQVGKVVNVGSNIYYETVPEIAAMIEGNYPKDYIENCRSVAARINQEDMQNYYKGNLNKKVLSTLQKELEDTFNFQDILSLITKGSVRPEVASLINKINGINEGEYL